MQDDIIGTNVKVLTEIEEWKMMTALLPATASDHKRCIKARALGSCRSNFPASQDARATEVRKWPILIRLFAYGLA